MQLYSLFFQRCQRLRPSPAENDRFGKALFLKPGAGDAFSEVPAQINNFIAFAMGGRVAEELVFGEKTNGAANDIERASELAKNMVCHLISYISTAPKSPGKGLDIICNVPDSLNILFDLFHTP